MQKFNGSLIRQFPSLVTGNAAAGVQVTVRIGTGLSLATLYATNNTAGATLSNPVTTDSKGFYSFYAADGRYNLQYSNGFPAQEIQLLDAVQWVSDAESGAGLLGQAASAATQSLNAATATLNTATSTANTAIANTAAAVSSVTAAADEAIAVEIPAQIARLGLEYPPIAYVAALTLDSHTKTYSEDGALYIWGGTLGTITTGDFDEAGWQPIQGDIQLRDDVEKGTSLIRDVKHVASVSALQLLEGEYNGQVVVLISKTTESGVGERRLWWDSASTETPNGETVFSVTGVSAGRWKRSEPYQLFDSLTKTLPVYNPPKNRPVFCLFGNTDLTNPLMLYPAVSGNKLVLEEYTRGSAQTENPTNVGGSDYMRIMRGSLVNYAVAGNIEPLSQMGTITSATISTGAYNAMIGAPASSTWAGTDHRYNGTHAMTERHVYVLSAAAEIEFAATYDSHVVFFLTGSGSASASVYVEVAGTYVLQEVVTALIGSGHLRVPIKTETKVKIVNTGSGDLYVAGVDFDSLLIASTHKKYSAIRYWRALDIGGSTARWLGPGFGSNDIAFKDSVTERFYGSFHGGHSDEEFDIYADGVRIEKPVTAIGFAFGQSITGQSISKLNSDVREYDCTSVCSFFDGGHCIDIEVFTENPVNMIEMNMGMSICDNRFDKIVSPRPVDLSGLTSGTEVSLGRENSSVTLMDAATQQSIETVLTQFDFSNADTSGIYVLVRDDDNKVYCNPLRNSDGVSSGAKFRLYHIFRS